MLVSQNLRLGFRVSKLDSFEAQVLFQFCLIRQRSFNLSLPDLCRKIEGPLLVGYKLINNNNFKDRSFQWLLILDILKNPVKITLTKKGNSLGNNPLPVSLFTYYSLSSPFPKKLASHNFVLSKDDKVGNKTANKQERQRKKREKDWNRFAKKGPNFGFCTCVKNKKAV